MGSVQAAVILKHIRQLVTAQANEQLTDRELLQRYSANRDEAAFTTLLERHGPMVWRVSCRGLAQAHDAEDVFQATFLVLIKKAASLRWRESIGGWLHEVARRLALKAKTAAQRREVHESRLPGSRLSRTVLQTVLPDGLQNRPTPLGPLDQLSVAEAQALVDEELGRLPERLRTPLVLCYLESATQDEAARQLGWSLSTLKRRLDRGRALLHRRLSRRGLTLSAALTIGLLTARGTVAAPLIQSTIHAAAGITSGKALLSASVLALVEETMTTMAAAKVKILATVLVLVSILSAGIGLAYRQAPPATLRAETPGDEQVKVEQPPPKEKEQAKVDQYGDPLPAEAMARVGSLRLRHGDGIWSVAFSPDGKTIVSGSGSFDPTVRFWDVADGKETRRLQVFPGFPQVGRGVMSMAFSPDGTKLAVGSSNSSRNNPVFLWEARTFKLRDSVRGHEHGVCTVAFSPNSKTLASGGYDKTIRLWDVIRRRELKQIKGHQGSVYSVAFSPDGATLASASEDKSIRLWEVSSGRILRTLRGHQQTVFAVAFSRNGKELASGSGDKTVRVWDAATGQERRVLRGHQGQIASVAFSPKGSFLASGGRDQSVRLWDPNTGAELRRFRANGLDISSIAFSPDGSSLVAGSFRNGIGLWDVATGKDLLPLMGHKGWVMSLQFSPDGITLASGGADGTILLSDPKTGKERGRLVESKNWINSMAFSPTDRALVAVDYQATFHLREAPSGKILRTFTGHKNGVMAVAVSPDGGTLASAAEDNTVRIWETANGREVRVLDGPWKDVNALAYSPDGKMLAVGGGFKDRAIYIHNLVSGAVLQRLPGHEHTVGSLAFLPDGKTLVSASADRTIRFWSLTSGKELHKIENKGNGAGGFNAITLSPDGKFVASAGQDHAVRIWETSTAKEVRAFAGHVGNVCAVAFAPDCRALASASTDSTVLIWDLARANTRATSSKLSAKVLEELWADLAGTDAAKAYKAIWAIVAVPKQTLPFLGKHLRPVPSIPAERIDPLIADLGSDRFAVRQKAMTELEKLTEAAEPSLRRALAAQPPLEMRRRVEQILEKLENSDLRAWRSLAVLERIATPQAQQILADLAHGGPAARLTQEAEACRQRLARQSGKSR